MRPFHAWVAALVLGASMASVYFLAALADDNTQADPARREWFRKQQIPEGARRRMQLQFKSCCDAGDVFRTRFRVGVAGEDQWEYWDDGRWLIVPADIISEEPSIDGLPILFKVGGKPVCFFKPNGGI